MPNYKKTVYINRNKVQLLNQLVYMTTEEICRQFGNKQGYVIWEHVNFPNGYSVTVVCAITELSNALPMVYGLLYHYDKVVKIIDIPRGDQYMFCRDWTAEHNSNTITLSLRAKPTRYMRMRMLRQSIRNILNLPRRTWQNIRLQKKTF